MALSVVLFVGDVLQPVDRFAVEFFVDGDVRHGGRRRRSVPVFLAGRDPDDIAGHDLFDRSAPALRPPAAGGYDQRLTERMRMPRRAGARLEGDARAGDAGGR